MLWNFRLGSLDLAPCSKSEHDSQPFSWRQGGAPASRPSHLQGPGPCCLAGWFWSPATSFSSGHIQCLRNRSHALRRDTRLLEGQEGRGLSKVPGANPAMQLRLLRRSRAPAHCNPSRSPSLTDLAFGKCQCGGGHSKKLPWGEQLSADPQEWILQGGTAPS